MSLENSQFDPNGGNKSTRACVGVENAKILLKIDYGEYLRKILGITRSKIFSILLIIQCLLVINKYNIIFIYFIENY